MRAFLNIADRARFKDNTRAGRAERSNRYRPRKVIYSGPPPKWQKIHREARKPKFSAEYLAYLRSPEWRKKRHAAMGRAQHQCERCHAGSRLICHHKTYVRLFHELPEDLEILCKSCHSKIHGHMQEVQPKPVKPRGSEEHLAARRANRAARYQIVDRLMREDPTLSRSDARRQARNLTARTALPIGFASDPGLV